MKVTLFVLLSALTTTSVLAFQDAQVHLKCEPDYTPNQGNDKSVQCGPGQLPCVYATGGATFINSPNQPTKCSQDGLLCQYPRYSEMTVQCPQGTITAQFAGAKNTYQNHAYNSADAYFMSQKCKSIVHPQKGYSTQDGDTLYVNCDE